MFSIKCQRMTDELLPRDKQAKHPSPAIMDQGPSDERQKDGDKSVWHGISAFVIFHKLRLPKYSSVCCYTRVCWVEKKMSWIY